MIMQDQSRRLSQPLQWGRREKGAIAVLAVCLVLGVAALVVHTVKTNNGAEAADCIRVTFASTLGGADLHGCGGQAKRICASGQFRNIQHELKLACGRAGFAYRAPS
jgi:hypothetical protein